MSRLAFSLYPSVEYIRFPLTPYTANTNGTFTPLFASSVRRQLRIIVESARSITGRDPASRNMERMTSLSSPF